MFCEFSVGAFDDAGLFTQRFSANALLAGLTDAAFEYRDWLGADHALFFLFAHKYYFTLSTRIAKPSAGIIHTPNKSQDTL